MSESNVFNAHQPEECMPV